MPSDMTTQGTSLQAASLVPLALRWYFIGHVKIIVHCYFLYAGAFRESFSMLFLLKTLFSPWKSIKNDYPQKGFNVQAMIESFFLNATTRGIGALIRLGAILAGLVLQVVLLVGFTAYLAWWIVFPVVLLALPFYLITAFFL